MRLATFVAGTVIAVVVLSVVVAMQDEPQVLWDRPFATAASTATPEPSPTAQSLGCQGSYASMTDDDVTRPTTADVVRFVGDFMEARVAGAEAETCLTQGALDTYEEAPADPVANPRPPCLYACRDAVSDFSVDEASVLQADANSFEAEVEVVLGRPGADRTYLERLTVGVGDAVEGGTRDLVVRSVRVESPSD